MISTRKLYAIEAVRDWETKFAPLISAMERSAILRVRRRSKAGRSWYVDETYVRVSGKWHYLYRAVDRGGNLVDSMLSEKRDMDAAKRFFIQAKDVVDNSYPGRASHMAISWIRTTHVILKV